MKRGMITWVMLWRTFIFSSSTMLRLYEKSKSSLLWYTSESLKLTRSHKHCRFKTTEPKTIFKDFLFLVYIIVSVNSHMFTEKMSVYSSYLRTKRTPYYIPKKYSSLGLPKNYWWYVDDVPPRLHYVSYVCI